jgi:hypothetical protein
MRQASWIVFLLMAVGLVSYVAAVDRQDVTLEEQTGPLAPLEGGMPSPKP